MRQAFFVRTAKTLIRLVCVFAGRTVILLVLSWGGSNTFKSKCYNSYCRSSLHSNMKSWYKKQVAWLFTEYDVARGILQFQCKTWEFRAASYSVNSQTIIVTVRQLYWSRKYVLWWLLSFTIDKICYQYVHSFIFSFVLCKTLIDLLTSHSKRFRSLYYRRRLLIELRKHIFIFVFEFS